MISVHMFNRIARGMELDKSPNRKLNILQALSEEVGEYALATRVESNTKLGNPRFLRESAAVEALDVALIAFEAYIDAGGTYEDLEPTMDRKLAKWEKTLVEQKPTPLNGPPRKEWTS